MKIKLLPAPLLLAVLVCSPCRAAGAGAPPEAAGAAGCKIIQTVRAIFPERLRNSGVTRGEARVLLQVDAAGRLTDTLVAAYTHEAFAKEAVWATSQWKFEPGAVDGEPAGGVLEITFAFRMNEMAVLVSQGRTPEDPGLPAGTYRYHPVSLRELDRIPTPISVMPPPYPKAWADRGIKGKVTVEFYIDETGRARMPVVIAGDSRLLGGAAIATVQQWRFSPPTRAGAPALVKAQQDFSFGSQ